MMKTSVLVYSVDIGHAECGQHESHMYDHVPHQLVIGDGLHCHERFQQVDRFLEKFEAQKQHGQTESEVNWRSNQRLAYKVLSIIRSIDDVLCWDRRNLPDHVRR